MQLSWISTVTIDVGKINEYKARLIAGGMPKELATSIAEKTLATKKASLDGSTAQSIPRKEVSADKKTKALKVERAGAVATSIAVGIALSAKTPRKKDAVSSEKKANQPKKNASVPARKKPKTQMTKEDAENPQLSLFDVAPWPDNLRVLPNDLARSSLFTVRNKAKKRESREAYPLYVLSKGVNITYTGIELRADDDELVWAQCLEFLKHTPFGEPVTFTVYQMCKELGWAFNGHYYARVEKCLSRLQATALQISSERLGRLESVSMIEHFAIIARGTRKARCEVILNKRMADLFLGKYYSKIEFSKYRKLTPIARRMFDYFVSHKKPYPMLLESFRELCNSDSKRVNRWTEQVSNACAELQESGLVEKTWVEKGKVHCVR